MPYLRFSRDQRGYENTYVLHTYRRDGRTLPRLLYWFRTPPSLKVGRHALDADAIRAIEESNPDLAFDWTKMLKVRPATILEERRRRTSSKAGTAKRGRRGPARKEPVSASATAGSVLSETPDSRVAEVVPDEAVSTVVVPADLVSDQAMRADVEAEELARAPEASAEGAGGEIEQLADDGEVPLGVAGEDDELPPGVELEHPVVTLMGDEALAKIRTRFAEIQLRIAEKFDDPSAGEEIRAQAEALNPDRWATIEAAVRGIETFEAKAEAIRGVLGRRRPRARRAGGQMGANLSGPNDVQI